MADDVFISDEERLRLGIVLKQLGMKQQELAQALGVSPAAVSRFLSVGADRINLVPEKLRRLVEILDGRLAESRVIKTMKTDEIELRKKKGTTEKEREWSRALVAAALALNSDSIKSSEAVIRDLLAGGATSGTQTSGPMLATPGGALSVQATNYVRRAADEEIEGILKEGRSPASLVIAPIQGGTSSFLQRVYQRAHEMRDCWARIVHFEAAFAKGEPFTQLDLFRYLFQEIGIARGALSDENLDVHEMKDAFDAWAEATWRNVGRIVVVVDGLDEVFRNAGAITDPLALTNWFQALRNRAGGSQAPYDKLTLFVALTGTTWSAAHASPYFTNAGSLELDKFTPEQVAEAFKQLDVDVDAKGIDDVHRLFHGHPYLTELFAWSVRNGLGPYSARESALNLTSRYESHWERMKSEIKFLTGENFATERVLSAVLKAVQREPLSETDDAIWRSYRRGLQAFGLIEGSSLPRMCEFYRAAIKRELQ